jgi:hypothetical protein
VESNCSDTWAAGTIVKGSAKGTSVRNQAGANDCNNLLGTSNVPLNVTVKWKVPIGTQAANPSHVTFTSTVGGVDGTNHGTFDTTGSVTSGSFAGDSAMSHAVTKLTAAQLATACGSATGLAKVVLASGNASLS